MHQESASGNPSTPPAAQGGAADDPAQHPAENHAATPDHDQEGAAESSEAPGSASGGPAHVQPEMYAHPGDGVPPMMGSAPHMVPGMPIMGAPIPGSSYGEMGMIPSPGVGQAYGDAYAPIVMGGSPTTMSAPMMHAPASMGYIRSPGYMMPMAGAPYGAAPYGNVYGGGMPGRYPPAATYPRMGVNPPAMPPPQQVPMGRTVYVGNLPADASVDELLNLVKFGPIESVRLLPEKNCAFISFLNGHVAAAFHADSSVKRVTLNNQELKIGWGKPSAPPPAVVMAVQQQQATRNVYIGQLDPDTTEQQLRDDLSRFGPIDQVKIVRDQNIGFVHFLSIQTAMNVVAQLPNEPAWAGKHINYGKDRCAYVPKGQQQIQVHNSQAAAIGLAAATWLGYPTGYSSFNPSSPVGAVLSTLLSSQPGNEGGEREGEGGGVPSTGPMYPNPDPQYHQFGNRTVYLGNLHHDTTTEEICNHVRGGILQNIRHMADRHIAFVTFIDPHAALAFYHMASYSGITIHNRRIKIGWGKPSGPLSPAIALAVQAGASRNLYIGNIDDPEMLNEDKIRRDLSEYGEIELVNTLREKNCVCIAGA